MLVSKIDWVTDREDVVLPKSVEVPDGMSDDEIAEYLLNEYGFPVECYVRPWNDDIDEDTFGLHCL